MSNTNQSVPKPVKAFVDALSHEANLQQARERVEGLLQEAIDSGEPTEATPAFWKKLQAQVDRAAHS